MNSLQKEAGRPVTRGAGCLFTALMRIVQFFTEGGMLAPLERCYDACMKKFLLATLLVMVVAAPAFAATKHHHHHHHHHHKA
jgi:hypothetical protein